MAQNYYERAAPEQGCSPWTHSRVAPDSTCALVSPWIGRNVRANHVEEFNFIFWIWSFSYGALRLRSISKYHADIREWEVQKIIHKKHQAHEEALRINREQSEWIMKVRNQYLVEMGMLKNPKIPINHFWA